MASQPACDCSDTALLAPPAMALGPTPTALLAHPGSRHANRQLRGASSGNAYSDITNPNYDGEQPKPPQESPDLVPSLSASQLSDDELSDAALDPHLPSRAS